MHDAMERDFYIEFRCTEREREGDSGNGWLVMVVSRYVGIVKAGETSRLETRQPEMRGEREREGGESQDSRCGSLLFLSSLSSSFFLPSFFSFFHSTYYYPPCIISRLARSRLSRLSNSRFICAAQRVQDEAMQIVRGPCPREPPSFEPYRTDWTESGS